MTPEERAKRVVESWLHGGANDEADIACAIREAIEEDRRARIEESELERSLSRLLNLENAENPSNTPDFLLAKFLTKVLQAWNETMQERDRWYGTSQRPNGVFGIERGVK